MAVDMRVGIVLEVRAFPEARKPACQLHVDFGPELGARWTSAQETRFRDGGRGFVMGSGPITKSLVSSRWVSGSEGFRDGA